MARLSPCWILHKAICIYPRFLQRESIIERRNICIYIVIGHARRTRKKAKARLHGTDIISKRLFFILVTWFSSPSLRFTVHCLWSRRRFAMRIFLRAIEKQIYFVIQLVNWLDIPLTHWKYLYDNEHGKHWTDEIKIWDDGVKMCMQICW